MSDSILCLNFQNSNNSSALATVADVHPTLRGSFVALPSAPGAKLTAEQLAAVAGGRNVQMLLRDILAIGARILREHEAEAVDERAA